MGGSQGCAAEQELCVWGELLKEAPLGGGGPRFVAVWTGPHGRSASDGGA